ncbi:Osteopetrosis-associated transmembrane protein 1 [Nymphon striatum]|nr:Osteopetrosis-associated transmembrane protein 1 [Nymphon striatum]
MIDRYGKRCSEFLVDQDRTNIIKSVKNSVNELWNDAHCFNCFKSHSVKNFTPSYEFSSEYVKFLQLTNSTYDCINEHTVEEVEYFRADYEIQDVIKNATESPCKPCYDEYLKMNKYFQNLEDTHDLNVCMDIADTMNTTRQRWVKKYDCHLKTEQDIAVIITGSLVLLIPAVFYVLMYFTTYSKEHKILRRIYDDPIIVSEISRKRHKYLLS